jgi:hypothetical protein
MGLRTDSLPASQRAPGVLNPAQPRLTGPTRLQEGIARRADGSDAAVLSESLRARLGSLRGGGDGRGAPASALQQASGFLGPTKGSQVFAADPRLSSPGEARVPQPPRANDALGPEGPIRTPFRSPVFSRDDDAGIGHTVDLRA